MLTEEEFENLKARMKNKDFVAGLDASDLCIYAIQLIDYCDDQRIQHIRAQMDLHSRITKFYRNDVFDCSTSIIDEGWLEEVIPTIVIGVS
jgi:hypothetical protein